MMLQNMRNLLITIISHHLATYGFIQHTIITTFLNHLENLSHISKEGSFDNALEL